MSIWEEHPLARAFWNNGSAGIPIYDMHGHMGTLNTIYFARAEAATMVAHLKRIGVKHLTFSHHYALFEPSFRNSRVHEICREFPDILRMYVAINPHYPDHIREDLAQFDAWAPFAVGLKLLPDYHATPACDPKYEYALAFAEERRLPVLCHTWGHSQNNGFPQLMKIVVKYPHITFFIAHCLFGDREGAARLVHESPGNVYLELTAVPGERDVLENLTAAVGSERLIFGTDLPWFDEYQAAGGVLSAKITENDMRNIFYANVERILGKEW